MFRPRSKPNNGEKIGTMKTSTTSSLLSLKSNFKYDRLFGILFYSIFQLKYQSIVNLINKYYFFSEENLKRSNKYNHKWSSLPRHCQRSYIFDTLSYIQNCAQNTVICRQCGCCYINRLLFALLTYFLPLFRIEI